MGDVRNRAAQKFLGPPLTVRMGVRHGHQGVYLVEQAVHGAFLAALNAALPPVQDILRDLMGSVLHTLLLMPQTADGHP